MAMSSAQRMRLLRERRAMEREGAVDRTKKWMKASFAHFVGDRILSLEESLDALGVTFQGKDFLRSDRQRFHSDGVEGEIAMTALERASTLAGTMIGAGQELCELVNEFKTLEVQRRIQEIEDAPLTDDTRKKALDDLIELKTILGELQRERRFPFHQIEVK